MRHAIRFSITFAAILALASPAATAELRVIEGRPIVDGVYVNGHGPYRFLVDTGSNINLIQASLAVSIGLKSTFAVPLATAGGSTLLGGVEGQELALDSVKADGQTILFSELKEVRQVFPGVQGVLGQCFLSRFDYLLDLRGKRLEFGKQQREGTHTPFRWVNGRPAISTSLGELALDSGANEVVLFGEMPSHSTQTWKTISGSQNVGLISGASLRIESRQIWKGDAVALPIPPESESNVSGLMPSSLFKSIYVCNSEGYVILN